MKTAAVIACRLESTRLFGKPMQRVGDHTILEHLLACLAHVSSLDEVTLALSDGEGRAVFEAFARARNVRTVVGSEKDVLQRLIIGAEAVDASIILRVTPDCPFIYWQNVDALVSRHIERGNDLTVTKGLPLGAFVEVISVDALRTSHARGEDRHRSEFCTLFISENPDHFQIDVVEAPDDVRRPDLRLTVDFPEDLIFMRQVWARLREKGCSIDIPSIVALCDSMPELAQINAGADTLYLWK